MSNLSQLDVQVERLLSSSGEEGSFLIITVGGTEDFMQLVGDASGVQLDFPLVSGRQLSFEATFKEVARREGLEVEENSDGASRFLDIDLPTDAAKVTAIVKTFLRDVYRVNEQTPLEFESEETDYADGF